MESTTTLPTTLPGVYRAVRETVARVMAFEDACGDHDDVAAFAALERVAIKAISEIHHLHNEDDLDPTCETLAVLAAGAGVLARETAPSTAIALDTWGGIGRLVDQLREEWDLQPAEVAS